MSELRLMRLRDGLLQWKRESGDRETKIRISELLDIIDEEDRESARLVDWCEKHAPNWEPKNDRERNVLIAFLANGEEGLSREEIAEITSGDAAVSCDESASIGRVRTFICRLKKDSLRPSGSKVEINAGHDGVYRTNDPSIVTLGEVLPPRDR
jgi:hypothetical protein